MLAKASLLFHVCIFATSGMCSWRGMLVQVAFFVVVFVCLRRHIASSNMLVSVASVPFADRASHSHQVNGPGHPNIYYVDVLSSTKTVTIWSLWFIDSGGILRRIQKTPFGAFSMKILTMFQQQQLRVYLSKPELRRTKGFAKHQIVEFVNKISL